MKPFRSNPNGVVPQSPGLARCQPWVIAPQVPSTPTGLRPGSRKARRPRSPPATTPLGLRALPSPLPRVVPSVQPWALLRNRFAVEGSHQTKRTRAAGLADYDQISPIMSKYNLSARAPPPVRRPPLPGGLFSAMVQFACKLRRSFRKEMNRGIRKIRGTPNPPACISAYSAYSAVYYFGCTTKSNLLAGCEGSPLRPRLSAPIRSPASPPPTPRGPWTGDCGPRTTCRPGAERRRACRAEAPA